MATGGQWQSETFDNGRHSHGERQGAPPSATPPGMYNPAPVGMGKDASAFGVVALSLRIAQIVFTFLAFSVMAATKETLSIAFYNYYSNTTQTSSGTVKFSSVKAFVGVLALNCIVCVYAIAQLVQCFLNMSSKGFFISPATTSYAVLTFIFDTVLAYTLIAASAAGADSTANLSDSGYCDSLSAFCQKAQASVAMSFLAFFLLAASAALYPVRLFWLAKG